MLLNRAETLMMNNPIRALIQRHFEARRLRRLGGRVPHARVLEVGCGRGRRLLEHPQENRFDRARFSRALEAAGFRVLATRELWGWFGWYVADKSA